MKLVWRVLVQQIGHPTAEFFIKCKGLHSYFERNGGSLATAVGNAEHSMDEKVASGRDYTYSELGRLMEELQRFENQNI